MVRRIFLVLDNEEFEALLSKKGSLSWKQFLVDPIIYGSPSPSKKPGRKASRKRKYGQS